MNRIIYLLLALCASVFSMESVEVPGIDKALQGLWHVTASSDDKGATLREVDQIVGRATALSFRTTGGSVFSVKRVIQTVKDGKTGNISIFEAPAPTYGVAETDTPGTFLLQVFSGDGNGKVKETARFLLDIQR